MSIFKSPKNPPPTIPYYSVRKVHKDLYDADVQLQTSKTRQAVVERYRDDIATVATNLRTRMDALSTTKADSLKGNEDARNTWIRQQVDELIEEEIAKPEGETFYYNVIPDVGAVKRNLRSGIPRHSDGYATLAPTLRPMVDPTVNRAFQLNQIIQDENRKRGQYAMEEARDLPVGISKVVGNTEFVIAIGSITFTPIAAYMDVYMGTEMPRSGHWLSFQAQAVEIFPEGFGGETNRLLLADDIPIRLSNAARLTLKGTEQRTFV